MDLILSSGFLAFGRQTGFLAAVEAADLSVDAVCGTSSGALAGSLWAAGLSASRVFEILSERSPLASVRPSWTPWRGAFTLDPMVARLIDLLPPTFEALDRPLGVGVVVEGAHRLLTQGPLPEAVAASCAVPGLFTPRRLGGRDCWDGGALDRTALEAWRAWRGPQVQGLLHLVQRSAGAMGEAQDPQVRIVHSPRAGARLWSLGDVKGRYAETRKATLDAFAELGLGSALRVDEPHAKPIA